MQPSWKKKCSPCCASDPSPLVCSHVWYSAGVITITWPITALAGGAGGIALSGSGGIALGANLQTDGGFVSLGGNTTLTRDVTIDTDDHGPAPVTYADGERFGPLPVTLEVVPGALRVLA